jgi:hypothetical protein
MKFHEGQQIFVCANLGGQVIRQKGIILRVDEECVCAGSFATEYRNMQEYEFAPDGSGEHVWLEARMT